MITKDGKLDKIDEFRGAYSFLSNFYPCEIEYEGQKYPSTEHAYQAAKTLDLEKRRLLASVPVKQVKRLGRSLRQRPDWEEVKLRVMWHLILKKFAIPELKEKLLATGDAELIEGNWWGDTFWGVCKGIGENHLGKILMRARTYYSIPGS